MTPPGISGREDILELLQTIGSHLGMAIALRDSAHYSNAILTAELAGVKSEDIDISVENELLTLRVFVDKSVVEVFAGDRLCVAMRVYPGREDSLGVSLRAQGRDAQLNSLDAWQMENIYR